MVSKAVNTLLTQQLERVAEVEKQLAESKTEKHARRKAAAEATEKYNNLKSELEAEKAVLSYLEKIKRQEDSYLHEKLRMAEELEDFSLPPLAETVKTLRTLRPESEKSSSSAEKSCTCNKSSS